MIRDHGQAKKYYHDMEGYNGRLDAIQTGILSVKLKHLPEWNAQRRERAEEYKKLFAASEAGLQAPLSLRGRARCITCMSSGRRTGTG